jgi:LacI family transcriptional regulator
VAAITVSRALRGQDNVRPELRARIERLAKRRGYRADPVLGSVMGTLRKERGQHYLGTVAFVWTHALSSADAEYRGVCAQAAALGYRVEPLRPWKQGLDERDVSRILWARGIRGVLLGPNHSGARPRYDLDWGKFSTVLIGSSLVNAGVTRVLRDYFQDAKTAIEAMRAKGFKRTGLVLEEGIHERTDRRYAAAFALHAGQRPPTAAQLTHVVNAGASFAEQRKGFLRWLDKRRPDSVIADFAPCHEWLRKEAPCVAAGFAGLAVQPAQVGVTGVRPDFERIGAEAMRMLDGLLRSGQVGLHPGPVNLLVPGIWQEGG